MQNEKCKRQNGEGRLALGRNWASAQKNEPKHPLPRRSSLIAHRWLLAPVIGIAGFCLVAAFSITGRGDESVAALCLIAFILGGVRISVGSAAGERRAHVDSCGAVAFGAALACGPLGAAAPAALSALGAIFLNPTPREPFWTSAYNVAVLPVKAAAAGLVFMAAGGNFASPLDAVSVLPALAAAVVYVIADRLLDGNASTPGRLVTLGFGYAIAGAASAFPTHSVLLPGLPIALILLRLLRLHRTDLQAETAEPDQAETKPSLIDPRTGLANLRYLEMFLHQEISRADRSDHPVTLLLIDIDDFRPINESDGTQTGDRFMAALGAGFKRMLREYDVVTHYKDDEFVIVLPETDATLGAEIARRLHSGLSGQVLPARARFSVGVATYPAHGTSIDSLIASAHHALNRAKFSGKNTVRTCDELAKAS